MKNKKTKIIIMVLVFILIAIVGFFIGVKLADNNIKLEELPKPEITGGSRGELGIDKNINESTIDKYLNRKDSVYRDMRMLEDPGNYEAIGGDRFLSGYIEGFEVVPLPYIIPVTGLPSEVGDTYTGNTLFYNENGKYIANYEESMKIIEKLFPKDKVIFLMCGGGGYAGMTKSFLVSMGWDENKIYNVGGYWYYKGKHNIEVKKEVNGKVTYDFDKVPYHKIEFDKLTKSANYKEPTVKVTELKINTNEIELEEGTSFQLSVIALPNEASNKEIKWTSDDESVATVLDDGLVKAIKEGETTITAISVDSNKKVTCTVTVKKSENSNLIRIDDVSNEANEIYSYDLDKIRKSFDEKVYDENRNTKSEYANSDGSVNDLYRTEYSKFREEFEEATQNRIKILNKLLDEKKSFILLVMNKECEKKDYYVLEGAEKILNQNNYSYIKLGTSPYNGDETLYDSNIDTDSYKGGSVIIIKEGKLYATIDPDGDSLKSDEETKTWLRKYIKID